MKKAYPISYLELEQLFVSICKGQKCQNLSFIKQRFISMLILAFSSFTRFEEIHFLKIEQIVLIDSDFSVHFLKGKTYRESRYGVIPFIAKKDFNPAEIFGIYYERVAKLHAERNSTVDFLFPNIRVVKGNEFICLL